MKTQLQLSAAACTGNPCGCPANNNVPPLAVRASLAGAPSNGNVRAYCIRPSKGHPQGVPLRFAQWIFLQFCIFAFLPLFAQTPTPDFTDPRDGETYKTVIMPDGKRWMAENLRYRKGLYNPVFGYMGHNSVAVTSNIASPGTNLQKTYYCPGPGPLPTSPNTSTTSQTDPLICEYEGCLYPFWTAYGQNQGTANVFTTLGEQGVCPDGWHLPSDGEWSALSTQLNNDYSSLQVLDAGRRNYTGVYVDRTLRAYFWTSTGSGTAAVSRSFLNGVITRKTSQPASDALSVRCVEGDVVLKPEILFSGSSACSTDTVWATQGHTSYIFNINGVDQTVQTLPYFFVKSTTQQTVAVKVKVKNAEGVESKYSDTVSFTVYPEYKIKTHPANVSVACGSVIAARVVVVSGGPDNTYTYQWQQSSVSGGPFSDVSAGAGAQTASFSPLPAANTYYRAAVTHAVCGTIYSNAALVSITTVNPTISKQPVSATICAGQTPATLSISVSGGSGNYAYQWRDGSTNIVGATASSYSPPALMATKSYSCVVSYSDGCAGSTISNTSTITVSNLIFTTQPVSAAISGCTNPSAFTVAVSNTSGTTYQWQYSMDNVNWSNAATTHGSGPTSTSFTPIKLSSNTYYRCIATNGVCTATSNVISLSIAVSSYVAATYSSASTASTHVINAPGNDVNGATGVLTDGRDGKTYTTKKMPDGQWWMTKNLEVGTCPNGTTGWNTTVNATWGSTYDQASNWSINGTALRGKCRQNDTYGYLYNWIAATQFPNGCGYGQDCPASNWQNKWVQGICPDGWRLPTGGTCGDFVNMPASTTLSTWNSTWLGVYGGHCSSTGSMGHQGSIAYYWSSTQSTTNAGYTLDYNSNLADPTANYNKHYGFSLRCLQN